MTIDREILGGLDLSSSAEHASLHFLSFKIGATPTQGKDDGGLGTWTRTGTGVFRFTFTGKRTKVLGLVGEPVLVNPDAPADSARITGYSVGTASAAAYIEVTTYDNATPSHTAPMATLEVMLGVWTQRSERA